MSDSPDRPVGLKAAGRRVWDATVDKYTLNPAELADLAAACRTADEPSRLEAQLKIAPTMTEGSQGQPVVNPLFAAVAKHREVLARLLDKVSLPSDGEEAGLSGVAKAKARAATARWRQRKAEAERRRGAA